MGPRVVTRGNHISTRKGPKKVASSEIATNKGTTKRESITPLRREHETSKELQGIHNREQTARTSETREQQKSEGTERAPRFI
jgi:hypothetical protein